MLPTFSQNGVTIVAQRWSPYSAFSAGVFNHSELGGQWMGQKKLTSDWTALRFYLSSNGVDWRLVGTDLLASFNTAVDEIGIGSINRAASDFTNYDLFESISVS